MCYLLLLLHLQLPQKLLMAEIIPFLQATMLERHFLKRNEVTSEVFFSCFLNVFLIAKAFSSIVKEFTLDSYKILTFWDIK